MASSKQQSPETEFVIGGNGRHGGGGVHLWKVLEADGSEDPFARDLISVSFLSILPHSTIDPPLLSILVFVRPRISPRHPSSRQGTTK